MSRLRVSLAVTLACFVASESGAASDAPSTRADSFSLCRAYLRESTDSPALARFAEAFELDADGGFKLLKSNVRHWSAAGGVHTLEVGEPFANLHATRSGSSALPAYDFVLATAKPSVHRLRMEIRAGACLVSKVSILEAKGERNLYSFDACPVRFPLERATTDECRRAEFAATNADPRFRSVGAGSSGSGSNGSPVAK